MSKFKILMMLLSVLLLSGCGAASPRTESGIIEDLNNTSLTTDYSNANRGIPYEVTEIEIIKRNTDTENNMDYIHCSFTANDGYSEMNGEAELLYGYYSEGGWCLDDSSSYVYNVSYSPLSGVDEMDALSLVLESNPCYQTAKFVDRTTYLDEGLEYLIFDVSSEGEVYSITGNVTVECMYDSTTGDWMYCGTYPDDTCGIQWNLHGTYALIPGEHENLYGRTLLYFGEYIDNDFYENTVDQYVMSFEFASDNDYSYYDAGWYDLEPFRVYLDDGYLYADDMDYEYIQFDANSLYIEDHPDYIFTKISDGVADPKAYSDVVGIGYAGPDIGGEELIDFEVIPFEPYYY